MSEIYGLAQRINDEESGNRPLIDESVYRQAAYQFDGWPADSNDDPPGI